MRQKSEEKCKAQSKVKSEDKHVAKERGYA